VKAALAGGKQVRVTHPDGTDLRFGTEGQPVVLSDGAISPSAWPRAARRGCSACQGLPARSAGAAPTPR